MQESNNNSKIDWMFLLFLGGVTNVKLYVKILTVVIYVFYVVIKHYRFRKPISINLFYFLMPVIGLIGAALHESFSEHSYVIAFAFGTMLWFSAGIVSYLLLISTENISPVAMHNTLKAFFAINALVSFGEIVKMIIDSGHPIPYWYYGGNMYYGGATGDHVYGITGNISVTNAVICALGCLYFTFKKELKWAVLCLIVSILCTSNLTLIVLLSILALIILFVKDRTIKKYAVYMCVISGIVYPLLTYDNIVYLGTVYKEDIKYKDYTENELAIIKNNTDVGWKKEQQFDVTAQTFKQQNTNYFKTKVSDSFYTTSKSDLKYIIYNGTFDGDKVNSLIPQDGIKRIFVEWYGMKHEETSLASYHYPIKLYTYQQSLNYLLSSPCNFIAGAGMGNFSSKQAIKTTGFGLQGGYPVKDLYVSRDFIEYHLYSLMYVLALPVSEHSIINMPNSIYNQIAGEYGVLGIVLFIVLYAGFFIKNIKKLRLGIYIALLSFCMFGFDYWFEMISITVFFELFLLIFIKETNAT